MAEEASTPAFRLVARRCGRPQETASKTDEREGLLREPLLNGLQQRGRRDVEHGPPFEAFEGTVRELRGRCGDHLDPAVTDPFENRARMIHVVAVVERFLQGLFAQRVRPARRKERVERSEVAGVGGRRDHAELAGDREKDPAVVEARRDEAFDEGTQGRRVDR